MVRTGELEASGRHPCGGQSGICMPSAGCLDQYAAVAQLDDSPTLDQALSWAHAQQWREAMQEEIATCERMCVWKRMTLPPGRQVVGCRWVLTIKRNAAGEIERFRARLVAQGFSQRPGVDYDEVYAPTHRMTTLRALLAVGAAHDLEIEQLHMRTAYLNAPLGYEIYMKMPPGYSVETKKIRHHARPRRASATAPLRT